MMKYTGLNINKQDNNNTAEYNEIYRSSRVQLELNRGLVEPGMLQFI